MRELDFFLTIEKLSILARGLNEFLVENYALLLQGEKETRRRPVSIICTVVAEVYHELTRIAEIDPNQLLAGRTFQRSPVDNTGDSSYDKHDINC